MTEFNEISNITTALQAQLTPVVANAVTGANVRITRPVSGVTAPEVNLFLYRVTPNISVRNDGLPYRTQDGTLRQTTQIALDLHYLFSFNGDQTQLEPQRLLGSVVSFLEENPIVASSAMENVKFTMEMLTFEDLSRMWTIFFQTSYDVSVAYSASVVLIKGQAQGQQVPQAQQTIITTDLIQTASVNEDPNE